jgi:hypothetical protein
LLHYEDYPQQRYDMSGVALWPRLLPVLVDTKYAEIVERHKVAVDFFLNMSFLAGVLLLEYVSASLYFTARLSLGIALLILATSWLFYRFAIHAARSFGTTVKVSFDLHRADLIKKLNLEMPKNFYEETELWKRYTKFIVRNQVPPPDEPFFRYPRPPD